MPLFGKDAVAYLASAALDEVNTPADATWTEVDNLQDETGNFGADAIDITTRASAKAGWTSTAYTTKSGEIKFTFLNETGDVLADALVNAWINTSTVPMMFLSAARTVDGAMGLAANWAVNLTFNRPVKGVQSVDATLSAQSFQEWVTIEV